MFNLFRSAPKTPPTDAEIISEFDRLDAAANTELNSNSFGSARTKAIEAADEKRAYLKQHGVTDGKYEKMITDRLVSLTKTIEDNKELVRIRIGGAAKKPAAKKPAAKK